MDTDPPPRLADIRVLLVEDHEDTRFIIEHCFAAEGAAVAAVSSARRAIHLLGEQLFDIVVTDYSMPDETGLWLLERICEYPNPVPVIVLTGYMDADVEQLRRAPFARVIRKPVEVGHLGQEVAAVVQEARRA
jgi:CheY-like chemotaxis protein